MYYNELLVFNCVDHIFPVKDPFHKNKILGYANGKEFFNDLIWIIIVLVVHL